MPVPLAIQACEIREDGKRFGEPQQHVHAGSNAHILKAECVTMPVLPRARGRLGIRIVQS